MKIEKISISGFRGIPPVSPPDVEIKLTDSNNPIHNLLIYAPNAYGKSSIADAFEWFFKETVRGYEYCDNYDKENNAHIYLGEPGFINEGYVELTLSDGNHNHIVTKFFDKSGEKTKENLGSIKRKIEECKDEIIVLDHDKFRRFVSAAETTKFSSFSSLIGFENLDLFRSGLDSITSSSLSNQLEISPLSKRKESIDKLLDELLIKFCGEIEIDKTKNLDILEKKLELIITSFGTPLLPLGEEYSPLDKNYWSEIGKIITQKKEEDKNTNIQKELENLKTLSYSAMPFSDDLIADINKLQELIPDFSNLKDTHEKQLLSGLYETGIDIVSLHNSIDTKCPLCNSDFKKAELVKIIQQNIKDLDFYVFKELISKYKKLSTEIKIKISSELGRIISIQNPEIREKTDELKILISNEDLFFPDKFNEKNLISLCEKAILINNLLVEYSKNINDEIQKNSLLLTDNGYESYSIRYRNLTSIRDLFFNIRETSNELKSITIELKVKEEVIETLRNISKRFRDELDDFSVRVANHITKDIDAYYKELHPEDNIRPFLDVKVSGKKRIVKLNCDFKGKTNKDAASLLSESHRNSLGLAIFLAFQKYKQLTNKGLDFLVLDDVTQSFDTEHRANLIDLLENPEYPEISNKQIIFLTHDRTLADLIKRPGDEEIRRNWIRQDIKNWWTQKMLLEIEEDYLTKADNYANQGDAIAAAVYARRALEQTYKSILKNCKVRVLFNEKPWRFSLENMRNEIHREIIKIWDNGVGIIDPTTPTFKKAFTSQRILNLTIHDSTFLDNPMTVGDVKNSIGTIRDLQSLFKCKGCGKYFHTLEAQTDKTGNKIQLRCKQNSCKAIIP